MCSAELAKARDKAGGFDRIAAPFGNGNKAKNQIVISAGAFGMIGVFRSSSRQAAGSARPLVTLSLPQKAEESLCVF